MYQAVSNLFKYYKNNPIWFVQKNIRCYQTRKATSSFPTKWHFLYTAQIIFLELHTIFYNFQTKLIPQAQILTAKQRTETKYLGVSISRIVIVAMTSHKLMCWFILKFRKFILAKDFRGWHYCGGLIYSTMKSDETYPIGSTIIFYQVSCKIINNNV